MKVLVCGSRDWHDAVPIYARISELPGDAEIITGDARGVDTIAARAAHETQRKYTVVRADWQKYGQRAGIVRNFAMLDMRPDLVLAFTLGTPGTQHTINEARRRAIPIEVFRPPPMSQLGETG